MLNSEEAALSVPPTVEGLVPILATPFHADGSLDLVSLRRLAEFQLSSGVHGVAVLGMASEAFALTTAERRLITHAVAEVVAGQIPLVVGVAATSTVTAVEQTNEAAAAGADTVMVLPPFMVPPSPAQLPAFYAAVAAVGPEVMVQDAPGATGVAMSPQQIVELAGIAGITSVKVEAPPTAPKVAAVVDRIEEPGFVVLGGQNAQFLLDELAAGAVGSMPACEIPDLLAPVFTDWRAGRYADARARFDLLLPLLVYGLQSGIAWAVHKEVLVRRGLIEHAAVRLPARELDARARSGLTAILDRLELPAGTLPLTGIH
ncbi:4-hydroxy-tetrahydrodipicolinate synthase [Kribbella sp. VKM Ac-2527]|uniref:4-hydroxy-tetrahydrodipicolinate synthase n=1 Tax=Kribbella caucasensis TaxID=2512215 RepID=A0A4R6KJV8_9ACTN|nr:dihydrodipicolinate synthase family protein [Kribbella sp. VKM Ac-2527]TDO49164.1 4-hydroxy-tetrahydrodipicolinate synthase [Kribbella sp. VKM Ac-2527]